MERQAILDLFRDCIVSLDPEDRKYYFGEGFICLSTGEKIKLESFDLISIKKEKDHYEIMLEQEQTGLTSARIDLYNDYIYLVNGIITGPFSETIFRLENIVFIKISQIEKEHKHSDCK